MIRMPIEKIVEKIKEASGVSEEEIKSKVKNKLEELAGLISEEGAAHIVANELNVKLYDQDFGRLKITNILSGMRNVEAVGKVQTVYPVNEFTRKDGVKGKVASLWLADDTGAIRAALWGSHAEKVGDMKEGSVVRVRGCYVKENNGKPELHLNDKSEIEVDPADEKVENVVERQTVRENERKKISELQEGMRNIELLSTIVQVFDMRFFEMCPQCNKRVRQRGEDSFVCDEHGTVEPYFSYVMNLFLDDGSDTISVFWAKQVQQLLGKEDDDMQKMKEDKTVQDLLKDELSGKIVKIAGSVKKNRMFDRLEFNVFEVDAKPNPEDELKSMKVDSEDVPSIMDLEPEKGEELNEEEH